MEPTPIPIKVFLVDDLEELTTTLADGLSRISKGDVVVALIANSLSQALSFVPQLETNEVKVAVLDLNLGYGGEGQDVLQAIQTHAPSVKTIGFSSDKFPGVDLDLTAGTSMAELIEAIRSLAK